ncbi:MAG: ZPR1 zinc finger domain-containing protein [Candidatus Lokiarchaeota archaeon]|nr:ZPR1 zinc finger domain-containing protein [Candidatus Lokiarchaeota archaeon]
MSEKAKEMEEEFSFKCPTCTNGTIKLTKTVYDMTDGDKMLIVKFECNECMFTTNDVIPLTTRIEPGIISLQVTNESDLKSKIYRSPVGILEIPELEVLVEPGPRADFYYTNVEGILERFQNAVQIYRNSLDGDHEKQKEIDEILNNISKAIKGDFKFTLVITDTGGGSYIIPQDESKYSYQKLDTPQLSDE